MLPCILSRYLHCLISSSFVSFSFFRKDNFLFEIYQNHNPGFHRLEVVELSLRTYTSVSWVVGFQDTQGPDRRYSPTSGSFCPGIVPPGIARIGCSSSGTGTGMRLAPCPSIAEAEQVKSILDFITFAFLFISYRIPPYSTLLNTSDSHITSPVLLDTESLLHLHICAFIPRFAITSFYKSVLVLIWPLT
ncbi:hypothetical protein M426DRAFT_190441 [Hypoxylon sp. CI-4A]|nr:hypothetical protein M426DRAFT_190441 [Hypoxylon sp. CI-4A]